jgi:hypothetical protein
MANGKSDIQLTDDFDGQVVVTCPDFCVDGGPGRRNGKAGKYRRALVHDQDGLVINWHDANSGDDYSGGVTINGLKTITGYPAPGTPPDEWGVVKELDYVTVRFKARSIELGCEPRKPGGVTILGDLQFNGQILINPEPTPEVPLQYRSTLVDLAAVIRELQQKVEALEQKIQKLDSVVPTETEGEVVAPGTQGPDFVSGQDNWRWCKKCEGLFFAGHPTQGKCPADGQPHSQEGSGDYRLLLLKHLSTPPVPNYGFGFGGSGVPPH